MHPSDGQIEAYTQRRLRSVELLEVDDHLAACDACRTRAAALARTGDAVSDLRSALLPPESHLTDAQVGEFVEGRLPAAERAAVEDHLRACAACAREVQELGTWARSRNRPRWRPYAAAAAAAVILLVIPLAARWRSPSLPGLDALPRELQQRVQAALQAGVAEPPPYLADLAGRAEVLMGEPAGESFRLVEPLGTASVSDRPAFRWQPLAGADSYTVSVADEGLRLVAKSPPVSGASWAPAQPLERGRVYVWQVTARRGAESFTAPAPPAPWAKFKVLEEERARALDRVAREQPESHLLLGILYAQEGARVEAIGHLDKVQTTDRHFDMAQRTLERLTAIDGGR